MTRVTFLHPDLGIGGAERLVVDAALALKKNGHDVNFVTTHHDLEHCFSETKDGTIPVTVVGTWLPRHILGRFYALCAYIRMIYAASYIIFCDQRPEVVFCDLVSVCIPILIVRIPYVVFYCHHPDQLLSSPGGCIKQLYRMPLNYLEEITTGMAHKVFVNSCYTNDVFRNTFRRLKIKPEILYPSINTDFFNKTRIVSIERVLDRKLPDDSIILLSINRYERKKKLSLAIEAFAELEKLLTKEVYKRVYLIMAGGYDKRVEENVEYHLELIELADELHVTDKVIFLRSPSDVDKISLLHHCKIVIYTPPNEHFGIVPLEAMYVGKPVIAHKSGGPTESIRSGETGFLVDLSGEAFASKIAYLITNPTHLENFGRSGQYRFLVTFSFAAFSARLNKAINDLTDTKTK
ncbi:alpha-1,3/1,6-mannosyltransferase ALG2 [Temnothorax curvispinosus]|uniref:Alpha-1,3/1,6-mannosyltransferase ALG2 n=1 Tax=Temnothorax curvispinosus TaxID=300111 RepID=A0A6J1PIS7_9HYME|nr:alpha-1,3/1,6-mannosyltransferase ALG2 [Temnothorax curvispinosus]XP_024869160.1 alpha-1,3/1,6-mannosyltransferase ALG2 [Temnothorax curvispinosus]XP_024869169.1 alpha-1,3/1,6-mannosyltransferase ALG2 [Temnothorax curvispinosus]